MKTSYASILFGLALAGGTFTPQAHAQVLLVVDNEFPDQVTNFSGDLTAAGVTYTTYDVAASGEPPSFSQLDAYSTVIWYTGTDGTELSFWFSEQAIRNYAQTGKKLWIVGQDLLYALYTTPTTFNFGDLAYDIMGIETYGVQAYGDDGNEGCPRMDVDAAVAPYFAPTLTWIFSTLWWADGVVPLDGMQPVYNMGPSSYILNGFTSMLHHRDPGVYNVMSTLFEPTYISTPAARVQFIQQTLAYMDLNTSVNELGMDLPALTLTNNPAMDRVEVISDRAFQTILVTGVDGREHFTLSGLHTERHVLDVTGLASGAYLVTIQTAQGQRATTRLVKQ